MCPTNDAQSICQIAVADYLRKPSNARLRLCNRTKALILSRLYMLNLAPRRPKDVDALDPAVLGDLYKKCNLDHQYEPVKLRTAIYSRFLAVIPGLVHEACAASFVRVTDDGKAYWDQQGGRHVFCSVDTALQWLEDRGKARAETSTPVKAQMTGPPLTEKEQAAAEVDVLLAARTTPLPATPTTWRFAEPVTFAPDNSTSAISSSSMLSAGGYLLSPKGKALETALEGGIGSVVEDIVQECKPTRLSTSSLFNMGTAALQHGGRHSLPSTPIILSAPRARSTTTVDLAVLAHGLPDITSLPPLPERRLSTPSESATTPTRRPAARAALRGRELVSLPTPAAAGPPSQMDEHGCVSTVLNEVDLPQRAALSLSPSEASSSGTTIRDARGMLRSPSPPPPPPPPPSQPDSLGVSRVSTASPPPPSGHPPPLLPRQQPDPTLPRQTVAPPAVTVSSRSLGAVPPSATPHNPTPTTVASSTRVSIIASLDEQIDAAAVRAQRALLEVERLTRAVRGELDDIVAGRGHSNVDTGGSNAAAGRMTVEDTLREMVQKCGEVERLKRDVDQHIGLRVAVESCKSLP